MKVSSLLVAVGVAVSFPVTAEPYAEWGVIGNGIPLQEIADGMEVPDASEVSIPLAPGGVFIGTAGDLSKCTMVVRTKRSVEEVCDFYRSKLTAPEYERVEEMELDSEPSCAIYRDGESKRGVGVWVYENEDPAFVKNGSTLVRVSYHMPSRTICEY
ncbi:MAG: hypothetical protein SWN10_21450 [Pseudomonadota bacterium]|nr:hypothetical protein [Pseudomonadota bacterium]